MKNLENLRNIKNILCNPTTIVELKEIKKTTSGVYFGLIKYGKTAELIFNNKNEKTFMKYLGLEFWNCHNNNCDGLTTIIRIENYEYSSNLKNFERFKVNNVYFDETELLALELI